jgi:hypothetical protein
MLRPIALVVTLASACACARAGDTEAEVLGSAADEADRIRMPPANTIPCNHPDYWRHSLTSTTLPLEVHYMQTGDKPMAERVLAELEDAWRVEVGELGFRPPPSDGGRCGRDGAFDAFLWRGHEQCYVDVLDAAPGVSWDAHIGYMVVDPWGPYGGDILESTVAHEFNHACQMADDWNDCPLVYEMTADFIQKIAVPDDENYKSYFSAFQSRPTWSIDRDDAYKTWFSYGAAMYLFYLRDRYFDGDARFVAEMWRRMRNPPGADVDPTRNHPSFEDALDAMLPARAGVGFIESVVGLARWRWYTGARDDGRHFVGGAGYAEVATQAAAAQPGVVALGPAPMVLGSVYVALAGAARAEMTVTLAGDPGVRWVVQAVPGLDGTDGDVLDLGSGAARLRFTAEGTRTLIVTALPLDPSAYEPNKKHDKRYPATLTLY